MHLSIYLPSVYLSTNGLHISIPRVSIYLSFAYLSTNCLSISIHHLSIYLHVVTSFRTSVTSPGLLARAMFERERAPTLSSAARARGLRRSLLLPCSPPVRPPCR